LSQLEIPPSIQALLSARLDLLDTVDRGVVEPASVIGLEFSSVAVAGLAAPTVREQVPDRLETMVRKRLVRPAPMPTEEEGAYRFDHILVRDAAYRRVLKRARAELHERFADWLEHSPGARDRPGEYDEIIGYHLEQAGLYRGQLGPADDHIRGLVKRASERLASAGRRAFVRGDLPAAIDLFSRARATLPADDPTRVILIPDLAEALLESGAFDAATALLHEAADAGDDAAARCAWARSRLVALLVDLYSGHEDGWAERAERLTASLMPIFDAANNDVGMATAWRIRYGALGSSYRFDEAVESAEAIIRHARAASDIRQQRRGAVAYAQAALHGPTYVDEAIARCEEIIQSVEGDRRTHAVVQLCLAQLVAMEGDIERARDLYRASRTMFEELGRSVLASSTSTESAPVEVLAGAFAAAERLLRDDYAALEAMGETFLRATVAGQLAHVLAAKGDISDAERAVADARKLAGADDVDAQVRWRAALALCRSGQSRHDEAISLATDAVALTSPSAPVLRAQTLADRASVLRAAGRAADAEADLFAAIALHDAKGNRTAAATLRAQGDPAVAWG
ncbi:MAG TPA: adenylate/guanylate cyclase domain-containing protein, partial [Candidatus Limnocylindria bacterium]|nr:adenylate/guanylate cyclase domain-containing protein [Candidatus Limnocylindria bacterium]